MHALICGSLAFDTIMVFRDQFKKHILPDQIHVLSVSFHVPELRKEFGGCAGNIAYNLKLLGGNPLIMATVGVDFGPYAERLDNLGLARTHVRPIHGMYTAQAFITTDIDDNQISAFHPGAMAEAKQNHVSEARDIGVGIVAPDAPDAMVQHCREFSARGTPFIFDPGQSLPIFDTTQLREVIELADYVTVNDYEARMIEDRLGRRVAEAAAKAKAVIVTLGGQGSVIHTRDRDITIPAVPPEAVADPTGCGDAYRAGILYGLESQWGWEKTGRLASLLGSIKIAQRGPQNHHFTRDSLAEQFRAAFGSELW
ncbi:MAG: carbohydrate kinase family protein [Betaproteobacteria bacterium]|nr:carbohydrate kinase family protein [Betaproteobacteria bacterium]